MSPEKEEEAAAKGFGMQIKKGKVGNRAGKGREGLEGLRREALSKAIVEDKKKKGAGR